MVAEIIERFPVNPIHGRFQYESKAYAEEQIIGILKEHEAGAGMANLMRKHRGSEKTSIGESRSTAARRWRS